MVTSNIFHCRKHSWPPQEYINRATLHLVIFFIFSCTDYVENFQFDFDSAAPPETAWRRRLNSHANRLKEFSVTFKEAIRMVRLGIRLWSYVREEASHGRKAPIDPFTRERCKPSASQGVPLGGMGSGCISRGFRGEFRQWQIVPGICEPSPVMANQFSIFISRDGGHKNYASVLAPGQHEGLGKSGDQGISSWGWNLSGQHSTYHALFPRAWTIYDGEPDPDLKVSCRQISPFIPHNYRDSSLPAAVFVYTVWVYILQLLNVKWCTPGSVMDFLNQVFAVPLKGCFLHFWAVLIFTVVWELWLARNNWIFADKRIEPGDLALQSLHKAVWWARVNIKNFELSDNDILVSWGLCFC